MFAQKQANIWYFGTRVGLDFNQTPPLVLSNGVANSEEGSAAISDYNGKLLFDTNGEILANRKHSLGKNGGGLKGDLSSTERGKPTVRKKIYEQVLYYLFVKYF